jgi:hypothetical protein
VLLPLVDTVRRNREKQAMRRPIVIARTVLVVAGEDTTRMLTGLLEEGTAVLQEVSVERAVGAARREPVDLIIAADEQRAGELKRRLIERPETAGIPVLLFGRVIEAPAFRAEIADLLPPPEPADTREWA